MVNKCECIIGIKGEDLVTFDELKEIIKRDAEFKKTNYKMWSIMGNKYSLNDYCDRRKSTDLTRFNYCPFCGKKIDWKAIKGGANG